MLKLLIADDEKLTREGILSDVEKSRLPFETILLADDGVHGFNLALTEKPDVILTDVRMPRMTGVEMAEKVLSQYPDTVIVFMSAYSDKEYLKAAIKLKAVRYVEKPLAMDELLETLEEAVENCRLKSRARDAKRLQEKELMFHLAVDLTSPDKAGLESALALSKELLLPIHSSTCFQTMVLESMTPLSGISDELLEHIYQGFTGRLAEHGLSYLLAFRSDRYAIVHLYSEKRILPEALKHCTDFLEKNFLKAGNFFLTAGPVVYGPENVPYSYKKAMELLDSCFFHQYNQLLTGLEDHSMARPPVDVLMDFNLALGDKQEEQAFGLLKQLEQSILNGPALTSSQVKDIYYRYFGKLDENGIRNHISLWSLEGVSPESIWEGIINCRTFFELHRLLETKTRQYFKLLHQNTAENPVVFQIKEFIHHNYAIPSLSVLDVSDSVHRSSSYVCTTFKNETGQTLNQYLTEYRIKMSKQFLGDPRYKVTDISSKVGYSDSNYYSKTFRKIVGLSPSEYREKMLS